MAPIRLVDRHLHVAMKDPRDVELVDRLRFASGVNHITGVFATDYGIRRAIGKLYHGQATFFDAQDAYGSIDPAVSGGGTTQAPFADKFTKTREHQFDTQELMARMTGETTLAPEAMDLPPRRAMDLPAPGDLDSRQIGLN